jgi:hypothetical protein
VGGNAGRKRRTILAGQQYLSEVIHVRTGEPFLQNWTASHSIAKKPFWSLNRDEGKEERRQP